MFKGTGTALITPFNEDLSVDYASLKKIVNQQVEGDIDALIVLGTTGESPVIDDDERKRIISTVQEEVNGKIPIIVGTGTNNTTHVVALNRMAEELSVDGLLIANPYYNKGTQQSLIEHYGYIAERTTLPIILYNVPSRTGMNILPDTAIRIFQNCKNVVGIKEASGNISQIAELIALKPDAFQVFSGNDDQTLAIIALGGTGAISVFSNPYPHLMKKLTNALFERDYGKAQKLNNKFNDMMNKLFIEASPAPVKYVMSKLGYCRNVLRLPLSILTEKNIPLLDEAMKKMD
ncbi:MAG TPA: 4-hydroxy-tetrahydrodipicolinate synthase [Ignavibacteriaceae bacterium]|nr:4-hydroxy-tetrahydrodipicolinate synthase [Ignavibacteriaceae bacterium]